MRIEVTPQALNVADGVFGPLGAAIGRVIANFDHPERATVLRFLREATSATREARTAASGSSHRPQPQPHPRKV